MDANVATLVSAAAAVLAAVFTAVNLYLTGRRQHITWTRQALEKACVDFLTAHYEHWDACRNLGAHETGAAESERSRKLQEMILEADATMMKCVTRFRVLTSPGLAKAALDLRTFNRLQLAALKDGSDDPEQGSVPREAERKASRDRFVQSAQTVLQISAKRLR